MKKRVTTVIIVVIFVIGISVLLYPTVSDYINKLSFNTRISEYTRVVAQTDTAELEELWDEAGIYNSEHTFNRFYELSPEEHAEYDRQLILEGSNVLGTLQIPSIGVALPLYHGADEEVLENGIGHIEGTSLPVGGIGTHTVLSGHRGLPSAKLLTDLDKVDIGDIFILEVLGHTLTYETDQIEVVLPDDVSFLAIDPEMDYCTLVTCTPYGINSHRLLVRGHRTDNVNVRVTPDALRIERSVLIPLAEAPVLIILLIFILFNSGRRKQKRA
jgi:sortase A